VYIIIQKLSQH